jgi:hypothetical protein
MLQHSSAARIAAAMAVSPAWGTTFGSCMPSHAGGLLSDRTSTQRFPRRTSAPIVSMLGSMLRVVVCATRGAESMLIRPNCVAALQSFRAREIAKINTHCVKQQEAAPSCFCRMTRPNLKNRRRDAPGLDARDRRSTNYRRGQIPDVHDRGVSLSRVVRLRVFNIFRASCSPAGMHLILGA